ncbi:MAG TPA: GNAT family N-acetyltransferase [Vicinamibacterales bacterium]
MQFSVRRATFGDEPILRAVRLQALSESPSAFGSTYERELARTTVDWQRWLSPGATFILDADEPRGIVAGARDGDETTVVNLMAMWVHPSLRGGAAADALVGSVLAWARGEGAREVRLRIARGNQRAQRCYERNGFRTTGREVRGEREGLVEIEMACPLTASPFGAC